MAYDTFTDQLMEAKRRARLSGRPLSQQEMAGISEGAAAGAADRLAKSRALNLQERTIGNQEEQFAQTFGMQQEQFAQNLAFEREKMAIANEQFEKTFGLSMQQAEQQAAQFEQTYGLSVMQAQAQAQQFAASLAFQQSQLAQQNSQFSQTLASQNYWNQQELNTANQAQARANSQKTGAGTGILVGGVVGGVVGSYVPVIGTYAGAAGGATLGGALGGMVGCIIITACTSKDSYEVNVARRYKDRYMDEETLTGYYTLCIGVVPLLKKHPLLRKIVKMALVDRLVDYGEWRLGMKDQMKFATSGAAKRLFIGLCRHIGKGVNSVLEVQHG